MKTLLLCCLLFTAGTSLALAESGHKLLAQSDDQRTIPDMSFIVKVTSYDGSQITDQSTLWGNLKIGPDHNRVLLNFREPASKHGQKFLVDGDSVYILFEHTSNPIRVSPLEVLTGQASDGDVVRTFAGDYNVTSVDPVTFQQASVLRFDLSAKVTANTSSYKTVQLWIDPKTLHLVYAKFYAASGVLLKKAFYRGYRSILGKDFPTVIDIWAGDNAQKHTIMQFTRISRQVLPATQFHRSALAFWNPEEPQ